MTLRNASPTIRNCDFYGNFSIGLQIQTNCQVLAQYCNL